MQIKDNIKNRLENNFLVVFLSEFFNKKLAVTNEKPNKDFLAPLLDLILCQMGSGG